MLINLKRVISCTLIACAVNFASYELLQNFAEVSASAQSQNDVSQADLRTSLEKLAIEARDATNGESFNKLYDIGLAYKALADLAAELGFSTERSQALSGAEQALSTIAHNTGIFSFIKQSRPARTETWSSSSDSGFGFGWSWSSPQTRTSCRYSWSPGQDSAALESSTSKLLQRVLIEQGKEEAALLAAEFGRSITVDKSVFYNTIRQGRSKGPSPCELAEDFAPRLTVNDIKQIAAREKATLITYSVISYQDDPHFIRNLREIRRTNSNGLGTIIGNYTRPSDLYIWVIQPNGEISFIKQPLSSLDLDSLGLKCASSGDCRPNEYSGLLGGVAIANGFVNIEDIENSNSRSQDSVPESSQLQNSELERNKQLHELYKFLIEPVETLLPNNPNERVIFVPQGALSFVPFVALRDSLDPSGQYLIEKHTIITAPNLRHLRLSQQKREALDDSRGDALVVGDPTLDLPFAAIEAEKVAQVLEGQGFDIDDLLVGSDADVRSVTKRMKDARIIHLASHGTLEDRASSELPTVSELLDIAPLRRPTSHADLQDLINNGHYDDILAEHGLGVISDDSPMGRLYGLYLSPLAGGSLLFSNSSNDRGNALTANDILNLDLSETELVVLSACNTGRGPLTPGGIVGLPFSLSIAGVPSIVVSLWEVPDESTSDLMIAFYKNLFDNPTENPNQDKAIGLRLAMLEMLEDNENSSPSQWAAFTLVGSAD
ncbi:CHAT domain-containing protein [Leptothoe sp. EHU-05/26/07-4]